MALKYLSLFTGIGGFELGIQQAYENIQKLRVKNKKQGIQRTRDKKGRQGERNNISPDGLTCIGYSEIDKYAIQIYQKHFPNHHNYGDITKINAEELPDFDLLCGGFPCQAFSIAGKRAGFNDTRGTLFFDIARIIKHKLPRLLLLENVKGLLSHEDGRTFRTIITTLDELGYDIQWQVLNSKNFGVPQNRERVYIVGHLRGTPRPKVFPIQRASEKDIEQLNHPKHSNDRVYGVGGISPTLNTMQGGGRQPFVKIPEATKKGYAEATQGQSINLAVMGSKTRRGRVSILRSWEVRHAGAEYQSWRRRSTLEYNNILSQRICKFDASLQQSASASKLIPMGGLNTEQIRKQKKSSKRKDISAKENLYRMSML